MAKERGLGLTLPAQSRPDSESFDIRTQPLKKWLGELPVGNIRETAKQLYRKLHEVNRHSHGWKQRYRFLEAIREPLHALQGDFAQRYTALSFPLPAKTQQIIALSQRLHLEMAIGYMAAIEGMLNSLFLFRDHHALKIMVHRACRHLNLGVLVAYQVYGQQRSGIWQRLHRLYAFAEQRNFHQDLIKDTLFAELPESSIARVYKQIVLLATTSPYRLRQGEAVAIHRSLARWAAHVQLLTIDDDDAPQALFALHLDSDDEPEYRSLDHHPCHNSACRLIDTRQLLGLLREETNHRPTPLFTPELYTRLIHGWEISPSRTERRNEGGEGIDVVVGMIHIHRMLASSQASTPAPALFSYGPQDKPPTVPKASSNADPWNPYSARENTATAKAPLPQPTAAPSPILHWQIINESVGGFRLAVPEEREDATLRVGEVVAVRELHSPTRWHLTVVRWIRHFDQGLLETGVQIIASDALPALAKNITPGKDKGEFQRVLLLPEAPERNLPVTLFTANGLFRTSDEVLLHVSGHKIAIVLGKAIHDSGSFVQFDFHTGEEKTAPTGQSAATGASPFEMLWEQL